MKPLLHPSLLAALSLAAASNAHAQQAPDAGQLLQQTRPGLQAPKPAPQLDLLQAPTGNAVSPGGPTVTLTDIKLSGNTVFTEAELRKVLGEVKGKRYDMAGLQGLARKLTEHYRAAGYPLARAIIPAQRLEGGVLEIRILEGHYGKVVARGAYAEAAQAYLADLVPGALITTPPLERATLILSDQPGIKISPVLRPGQELGTSDLIVDVAREPMFKGEAGLDNHGNRYSGQYRAKVSLQADSPFMLGDQIKGQALYSDEGLWQGSINYSLPLGASGLRGAIGYAHTYYELGKDFKNLQAHGTADIASLTLSYPLIRTRKANLTAAAGYQYKDMEDRQDAANQRNNKTSRLVPLTVQFDRRDGWGITYGALTFTAGELNLDSILEAADRSSNTNTRGRFNKWTFDLARLNTTPWSNLTVLGRFSAQWADKNLDSSESFILGGANGVRAYPNGEGTGDEGYLVQLEARYRIGAAEPFVFYDTGSVRINAKPDGIVPAVADNTRTLSGAGLGVRYAQGKLSLEASAAWRTHGGAPQSDTRDDTPRLWADVVYRF